jgi:hypothetical protein
MGNEISVEKKSVSGIMTPDEVAEFLRKSASWVYLHWQELGGVKLGGSIFFPRKEDLYELLFGKRQGVALRLHPERPKIHRSLVQDKKGGNPGRSKKKGRIEETQDSFGNSDRHGLFGAG